MRDPLSWSLSVGRISGIPVRLHMFFLLFAGFELVYAALEPEPLTPAASVAQVTAFLIMLFGAVLLHELGHCGAARRVGGYAREILMWPLGGLATVEYPQAPKYEFLVTIAGPAVNLVLGTFTAAVLLATGFRPPLRPLASVQSFEGDLLLDGWPFWAGTFFAINLMIVLFNLLPAFPMDGGRLLRAILWSRIGYRQGTLWAVQVGKLTAIGMVLVAIYLGLQDNRIGHTVLLLVGIFVYHSAEMERYRLVAADDWGTVDAWGLGGLGTGYGTEIDLEEPTELERPLPKARRKSWLRRWIERWRRAREERAKRLEREVEQRVDELLDRVRKYGIESLTAAEQRFLKRASKRYRSKLESRQD